MMTIRKCRMLLLLICGTAIAQNTTQNATAPPEPAVVEGVVLKLGTTNPIQSVVVSFTPISGSAKTGTTSADGRFTVSGLQPGYYSVSVTRTGFVRPPHASGPKNLTLTAGEHLKDVGLRMVATSAITGRVVDENGQPKDRVSVVPIRPHYEYGRQVMSPCYGGDGKSAMTDDTGVYRIYGLEPGDYYVAVADGACATQYYPDVSDPADAVRVKVQSGTEAGSIDFHLKKKELHTARFKLVLPPALTANTPLTTTQIVRRSRNGINTTEILNLGRNIGVDGDTLTTPGLPRGSYELFYDADLGVKIGHAAFEIMDRDIDGGEIVVRPNTALAGQIHAAGALPAGWTFNSARITLRPLDGRDRLMTTTIGTLSTAAADGSFLLAFAPNAGTTERPGTVAEGRYLVDVAGLAPVMYISAAKYGGHDALSAGLVIDGTSPNPLEITVDIGGTVTGTVRNAKDEIVADSRVVLIPAQNRRSNLLLFKTAFTDQHGNFSIRGVAPGDYGAIAWEDVEPGAWMNADFLKDFESRAVRVSVLGTSVVNTVVRVIPYSD